MDEQSQAEFIDWLSQQLQVETPEELQGKLQELGDEGIKKAFELFNKQKTQTNTAVAMAKHGAKLAKLKALKKGGSTVDWSKTNAIDENRLKNVKDKPTGSKTIKMNWSSQSK